jgi:HEAT repeat protein
VTTEQQTILVLSDDFAHDLFAQYLTSEGWSLHARDTRVEEVQSVEEVWINETNKGRVIHYVANSRMMTQYLWIRGHDIAPLVADLVARFNAYPQDELMTAVAEAETVRDLIVALFRVAVSFKPAFEQEVGDMFVYLAEHKNPAVRRAVVQSLLHTGWAQNLPLLEKLARDDAAVDVRDFATEALAALRSKHSA